MDDTTRIVFHDALAKSANAATRALADAVIATPGGRVTCWGDLVDYVRAHFLSDEDSLALWQVLADVGDRRPQLLFLDVNRARPAVLRALFADVTRVPPIVQCALVSMPEAAPLLATLPEALSPAAREIAASAPAARVRESAIYESHMGALRVQRGALPFSQDAVVRHINEAMQLLRPVVDAAPVAVSPTIAEPAPKPAAEVAQPQRVNADVAPIAPATEVQQPVRPTTEVVQALRPGGPS